MSKRWQKPSCFFFCCSWPIGSDPETDYSVEKNKTLVHCWAMERLSCWSPLKKKSVKASEKITVESHVVQYGLIVKKHSRNNCILKVAKEKVILNGFHAHASIMLIADICGNFLTRRFMSTFKTWCFFCPLMLSSEILPFPYIFLMINFRWQLF